MLEDRPDLQPFLFDKGFLIADRGSDWNLEEYPFYGNWSKSGCGDYDFIIHDRTTSFFCQKGDRVYFLIGHAYNPFSMEIREDQILEHLSAIESGQERNVYIDELTGVFLLGIIDGDGLHFLLDASGMQYGCYGRIDGRLFITSHMQLVGDLCGLRKTDYAERLVHYRWYHYMMGNYMPGDITCFRELTRIIPNTWVHTQGGEFEVERFYPDRPIGMCSTEEAYDQVILEGADIMKRTMLCIVDKWERPAISLTGGIDSNTTFAAANGLYDRFRTFSYISMYRESVDAEAAKTISDRFHTAHTCYDVPEDNALVEDFEIFKKIFIYNGGDIGDIKDNDARKKITLIRRDVGDVEVKSWISETIRAYAYKYFGRTKMPEDLKPRHYTSLYKIFFMNRRLVRETDRYFQEYLEHTDLKRHLFNYDESDFFVWEMMHGGKCGLDIGVMKSCFDITIPYNNRRFLDLMLRVPLEKRLNDDLHLDMKKVLNPSLYDMNIRVVNLNETDRRKKLANIYFTVNSHLRF